jgi:parvulin-like peptidyl-prolyl isomerase
MVNSSVRRFPVDLFPRFLAVPALLMAVAALMSGCHPAAPAVVDPKAPDFVVAEKGTWKITRADLNKEVDVLLKQHQTTADQVGPAKMPIIETGTLKNMVLKKLLLEKAAETPLKDSDKLEAAELDKIKASIPPGGKSLDDLLKANGMTIDDLKQQIHEKVAVENVLKTQAFKNVDPTDQQIDEMYLQNKDKFVIPAKIRASRVLVHVEETATPADKAAKKKIIDKAHDRVAKGEAFDKVATEVSEDQGSKAKGGDLGYFQKGENEPGFDDVAFSLKDGELSKVFTTPLGFQFVKVTSLQPAGLVPVADARNNIASYLREQNMEMQTQAYAKKLLADSGVVYHIALVDPPANMGQGGPGAPGGPEGAGAGGPDSAPPAGPDGAGQAAPDAAQAPAGPDASAPAAPAAPTTPPPAPAAPSAPASK